jgi:hypothetical protein
MAKFREFNDVGEDSSRCFSDLFDWIMHNNSEFGRRIVK